VSARTRPKKSGATGAQLIAPHRRGSRSLQLFSGLQHLRQRQIRRPRRHQQTLQRRRRTQTTSSAGTSGIAGWLFKSGADSAASGIKAKPAVAMAAPPASILNIFRRSMAVIGVSPERYLVTRKRETLRVSSAFKKSSVPSHKMITWRFFLEPPRVRCYQKPQRIASNVSPSSSIWHSRVAALMAPLPGCARSAARRAVAWY
jgi:hypothetical protein